MGGWQCWINVKYDNLRLITHYVYIFVALVMATVTYIAASSTFANGYEGKRKRQDKPLTI